MKKALFFSSMALFAVLLSACHRVEDRYTRGIGIYPGRPSEDFSPGLAPDDSYRNIAMLRPVYQSSAYDYNLTSQLLTDGIIENDMPAYISVATHKGIVPKNEREWLLDSKPVSSMTLNGTDVLIRYELNSEAKADSVDKIILKGTLEYLERKPRGWNFTCSGSNDGESWDELVYVRGYGLPGVERPDPFANITPQPGTRRRNLFFEPDTTMPRPSFTFTFQPPKPSRLINASFDFGKPVCYHFYKISMTAPCAEKWIFSDLDFFSHGNKLKMVPSHRFRSAWMSAGNKEEWVNIDLGSVSTFDRIKLHWIRKPSGGSVMISEDDRNWRELTRLPSVADQVDDISISKDAEAKARFVKFLFNQQDSVKHCVLSEIEIFGSGGLVTRPRAPEKPDGNILMLSGGGWKVQRISAVEATGEEISVAGFNSAGWVDATVPGTVLSSYRNAGAIPDPNYDDNQLLISESFFNSDFWYSNEFAIPEEFEGRRLWLNFNGINWKADVYVNGRAAGRIEGAFMRGKFDISDLIQPGKSNGLAVLVYKNDNIGVVKEQTALSTDKNGGILGGDNPTFHASVGWDWIPTIRGRNTGIWNDVYLKATGPVTIEDPFVRTDLPLPDTSRADISIEFRLRNSGKDEVAGKVLGKYGDINISEEVSIGPGETKLIRLNHKTHPQLHIDKPALWWPNGYGEPHLYDVSLSFEISGDVSDEINFKSGVKEMTFSEKNMTLNMYINGRRFIGRGGNWGFSESNLSYRGREYDAAVRYHKDMNFNIIRNWVGQVGDEEFFEACDRHGIMIWQDFWLANPADGPDPYDPAMFLRNADDLIRKIRNHPSVAIYAGRNEGNPPVVIDTALRRMVRQLHPGLHYISNSAMGMVSGGGPYRALPVRDYFLLYGYNKFHSERGMPNVMTYESLRQTLREDYLWPQNNHWGIHDYTIESAQSCASFNEMVEKGFGPVRDAREFTELAQWINYNGYRGMFEGRSRFRHGLLLWMSHPAWPSMVWQTYDYYLEPTAAYFGCKKASEPIHIQWNPVYDVVEVVNYNAGNHKNLTAKAQIFNMDGSLQWQKETSLNCREDSTVNCFKMAFPSGLSKVHFIKLSLAGNGEDISKNFYLRGAEDGNYQSLRSLPRINLGYTTKITRSGEEWLLTTTITNATDTPALMVRLKVVGKNSGERLLPIIYSDNYISLMPGEQEIVTMRIKDEDTRGERPSVDMSGFNLN